MKIRCLILIFHSCFAVAFAVLVSGCTFDPAKDRVHSSTTPDNVFHKGVWWIPIHAAGTTDEWFFIPEPAAVVAGDVKHRQGESVDVLVNGRVWRCTKEADGIDFKLGIDPPEVPPAPGSVIAFIVCLLAGAVGVISFVSAIAVLQKAKDIAAATDAKERQLAEDDRRQSDSQRKAHKAQQEAERLHEEAVEALRQEREGFEVQKTTHLAAVRESKIEHATPTEREWKTLSAAVRAQQFRGRATGQGLVVDYCFDPKTSGALIFAWEVTWSRPYAPTIVVRRDGTRIRRETGMFKGEFPAQFLPPARQHIFTFKLIDGDKELPNPLTMELTLPPFDAWQPEPPKPITAEERRQQREVKRMERYRYAEGFIKDPKKLKEKKTEIDGEILEEFGDE